MTALCYCSEHLTDGLVDEIALEQIVDDAQISSAAAKRSIPKLVNAGLWVEYPDVGFLINDYLEYNPTKADVEVKREQAKNRMQVVRANRKRTPREVRSAHTPSHTPSALGRFPQVAVDNSLRSVSV